MTPEACERLSHGLSGLVAQMGLEGSPRMFFEEDGVGTTDGRRAKKRITKRG
jgi:hypothetical protein